MAQTTPKISLPPGDLHPQLIHGSLSPPKPSSKMACRSVQTFLHSLPLSVPLLYNALLHFPQKIAPAPGDNIPHLTHSTQVIIPNGISISSAIFVWVPNTMLYNALSGGKKTPKTAPSPRDFVTVLEENWAMAIGNVHRKIGKGHACGSGDTLADRQTDTHRRAHHNTSPPLLLAK